MSYIVHRLRDTDFLTNCLSECVNLFGDFSSDRLSGTGSAALQCQEKCTYMTLSTQLAGDTIFNSIESFAGIAVLTVAGICLTQKIREINREIHDLKHSDLNDKDVSIFKTCLEGWGKSHLLGDFIKLMPLVLDVEIIQKAKENRIEGEISAKKRQKIWYAAVAVECFVFAAVFLWRKL